ncbi:MAG: hypothetical protein K9G24_10630 [Candidatus Nanopelagicales bacterium]|nr:hypothetical protein [Candidatus Nanopelagicales bacterium]MCF8538508.1 hypothetical protein [Candidatus Nanopelagicales bacterium]MCF8543524.1 hypothetical protein [Candidatus Nanopelagicales bacterium]MCF8558344.1 hypothetical protein [Candidatus Nanopelagicales bacterium]
MRTSERLGRYRLLACVSESVNGVSLWHAYDDTLDRAVSIRVVPLSHPRSANVVAAAQNAALVDDRRLLRVLDIIALPATDAAPAANGIVSEWAQGRTLAELLAGRDGTPMAASEALDLVADVARAIAAGAPEGIGHGRLRPSSVFVTDAGEIRVRGLGVDASVFGTDPMSNGAAAESVAEADVDALGCLTYLLTTGYWPGGVPLGLASAPRTGEQVLPPSQVRASVPENVDDVVARSLAVAPASRGRDAVDSAAAFAAAAGAAFDHVTPVTTSFKPVHVGPPSTRRRVLGVAGRLVAVALAVALVMGIGWAGWNLLTTDTAGEDVLADESSEILTSPALPVDDLEVVGVDQPFEIVGYRSYDPYGDDDGNGKPDKRKGRENDELAATVNDVDPDTAWLTSRYSSADLDGKGGVGLIIDLGENREVRQVSANLVGRGTGLDVRVADSIKRDPALWTPLGSAFAPGDRLDVRAPRAVPGRYVLLWFTQLPPEESGSGFQGGVRSVVVTG